MKNINLLTIINFCIILDVFSQSINPIDLKNEADTYFKKHKYKSAENAYHTLDSIQPGQTEIEYNLGVCYLHNGYKTKALDYLLRANKNIEKCSHDFFYYLGKAYHYNYKFDEARLSFEQYKSHLIKHRLGNKAKHLDVDRKMEVCNTAKDLVSKPLDIKITSIGAMVNSSFSEYTPVVSADEQKLYFTARKPNTTGGLKDQYDEEFFEDIYVSEKTSIGWGVPKSVGSHINTSNHDAIVSITSDGQKMVIYKHVHNELFDTYSGDLFYSDLIGDQWSDPQPFDHNVNSIHWDPSAHINSEENLLFFSSNKHGGFGGTDIYVSKKLSDGKWGKAINLGPKINTIYDDDAPFIMPDGKTLYFSSIGHENIGGHDIFKTVQDSLGNWSTPSNLGYPINTTADDLYFSWSADGKRIYFSSVREENGSNNSDIYFAEMAKTAENIVVLKGHTYNSLTKKPFSVTITVINLKTSKIHSEHHSNNANGKYLLLLPEGNNYKITMEKNGYLFQSFNIEIPESKSYLELEKNIYFDSLLAGKNTFLRNVFFENGDSKLNENSNDELDKIFKLLEANPSMYIEIVGNIDNLIDASHNKFLSESRAVAIQEYLLRKGIEDHRIISVGYPVLGINNDNIEEKIEHFEPELRIINNINNSRDKLKTHSTNKSNTHKHGEPVINSFLNESIYFPENESLVLHKLSNHKIAHIIYILNKYPSLKIRIETHYDENGDVKHNQHLATAREKIIYDELIKLGIDPQRLAITYYQDKPTGNLNQLHENSLKNRRVKFRVIAY